MSLRIPEIRVAATSCLISGCVLTAHAGPPSGYYQSTLGLAGSALRAELHRIVKSTHTPMLYSLTRGGLEMCDQDPVSAANVILIYSRRSEPKANFVKSPPQNATEWNREHLWPDSRGILGEGADYADLFNLRPADVTVNNDRANLAFEETDASASMILPGSPEAPQTSRDSNSWEPPPQVKGDIARSLFYMDLRYDGDGTLESDLALTDNMNLVSGNQPWMGRLTTLLLWHLEDPVSAEEVQRATTAHNASRETAIRSLIALSGCSKYLEIPFWSPARSQGHK